jgi:hypothetical protein
MLLMVLNDGSTYTDLDGCKMIEVPDNYESEDIEASLRNDKGYEYTVIADFTQSEVKEGN